MSLKDLSDKLAKWSLALQEFNFTIQYCKGLANVVADTLSKYVEAIIIQLEKLMNRIQTIKENTDKLPDLKIGLAASQLASMTWLERLFRLL